MKLLEKLRKKEINNNEIYSLVQKLNDKLAEQNVKLEAYNQNIKELKCQKIKDLEDQVVDIKARKMNSYEKQISNLKMQIESKDTVIAQQQQAIEKVNKQREEAKAELKDVKQQVKKLEKTIDKYKENGIVIPKKVKGTKAPKQTLKETVRPVKN